MKGDTLVASNGKELANDADHAAKKPKRVRTGCLTCRERHLKCDEGLPVCQNCRKSNRQCKRGVRLNFIDTQVKLPAVMAPTTHDWAVTFLDESRDIASEYKGGRARYISLETRPHPRHVNSGVGFNFAISATPVSDQQHQPLPPIQGMLPDAFQDDPSILNLESQRGEIHHRHAHSHSESTYSGSNMPTTAGTSYGTSEHLQSAVGGSRDYMRDPSEVLYMQVFVEEVGIWMDSMDSVKHFSELLPFHALSNNMLYNAFLACGARHLTLVNDTYSDERALQYYNTATSFLLNAIQDKNRDCVMAATTAVILNVYEIMTERALQRTNHIAGARALIKECGWNSRSAGVGAACFWLNITMELLSCLHFNWPVSWSPDEWGLDMDMSIPEPGVGKEELWTHRITYILAKVANFRAAIPSLGHEQSPRTEQMRLQNRYNEWQQLRTLADSWNRSIPRTMHPMGYVESYQTRSRSSFPEVWLIKRPTIVARLFYHTALLLLSQMNPFAPLDVSGDMRDMQQENSSLVCGMVAHSKDRGIASAAIRCLAIAAETLTDRTQQEEVIRIIEKINKETGWRVAFLYKELPLKWGWQQITDEIEPAARQDPRPELVQSLQLSQQQQHPLPPVVAPSSQSAQNYHQSRQSPLPPLPVTLQRSQPIVAVPPSLPPATRPSNPLITADFSMPQRPYQSYYVAPSTSLPQHHTQASYY